MFRPMPWILAVVLLGIAVSSGTAQEAVPLAAPPTLPAAEWSYPQIIIPARQPVLPPAPPGPPVIYVPAPAGPIPSFLPERTVRVDELPPPDVAPGQQHWAYVNLGIFQPFGLRVGVKIWPRPQNSLFLEAYLGSALFDAMYGFGLRMQHTAWTFANSDRVMVSPGVGVQILPDWDAHTRTLYYDPNNGRSYYVNSCTRNSLYFLFGDVDVSWLHDFSPHLGFELGAKFGLAGRVSGRVGRDYPSSVMFGKDFYPIFSLYSGLRF